MFIIYHDYCCVVIDSTVFAIMIVIVLHVVTSVVIVIIVIGSSCLCDLWGRYTLRDNSRLELRSVPPLPAFASWPRLRGFPPGAEGSAHANLKRKTKCQIQRLVTAHLPHEPN